MGFLALSSFLVPLLLLPFAVWLWAFLYQRKSKRNKQPFPLIALIQAKPQLAFTLVGLILTILGLGLRAATQPEPIGTFFSVAGVLLFAIGIYHVNKSKYPAWLTNSLQSIAKRLRVTQTQVVLLLASPLVAALASTASGDGLTMRAPFVALLAWALAIAAALLGAWPTKPAPIKISRNALIWAMILFGAAFLLRGLDAKGIPNTLTGDEASGGLFATEYLDSSFDNVFGFGWFSFPALYFYFQALSISIFGHTTLALRITSALGGALTVGAVYLAGRALYGHRAGLYTGVFLAGLHFHIHFSRIGLNNVWDGLWFTVILGLLWWAWKNERREVFLLAGFALGFSQYFYVSVRLLFILIPAWLFFAALNDRARFKRNTSSVILMFVVALVVFLPLAINYASHPDQFMAPMQRVSLIGSWLDNEQVATGQPAWRILADQMWLSIQAYTSTNLRHWYTPEVPILRSYAAGFFLLGFVLMVIDWRNPQHWLLALWLGAFTFSGGLSESTPAAQRYIGVAPACALVLGYGLSEISHRLTELWKTGKRAFPSLALIAVMLLALSDINFYFRKFTPRGEYSGTNTAIAQHLANYLNAHPEIEQVAFFGQPRMSYRSINSTAFLAPDVIGLDMAAPWGSLENPAITSAQVIFVFLPEHSAGMEAVLAAFPGSTVLDEFDMQGNLLYWVVVIGSGI